MGSWSIDKDHGPDRYGENPSTQRMNEELNKSLAKYNIECT
ncbi:MAG: hypothetical protein R2787_01025 [Saprospiraceae bacterium]